MQFPFSSSFVVFFLTFALLKVVVDARTQRDCGDVYSVREEVDANGKKEQRRIRVPSYQCPTTAHTDAEDRCCDPARFNCCREPTFFEMEMGKAIVITLAAVLLAIAITVVLIICFCNDRCILHKLIRKEAKPDYIAHPDEVANLTGTEMPSENKQHVRVYEVNTDVVYRQNKDLV
uniref:Uncharacterized protein n=1 Tax=Plectus sambesii TaxID=2011161 RepID=A0A914VSE6_9BILA